MIRMYLVVYLLSFNYFQSRIYCIFLNKLYGHAFITISFTIFLNLLADVYSKQFFDK
jgi:hypothetical protein